MLPPSGPADRPSPPVRGADLVVLYLPLAAMAILLSFSAPVIQAVLARLPGPKEALAAYGAALAVAIFLDSPTLMLLHTGNALAWDRESYRLTRNFAVGVTILLSVATALIGWTSLYDVVFREWLGVPDPIARLARVVRCLARKGMIPALAAHVHDRGLTVGAVSRFYLPLAATA